MYDSAFNRVEQKYLLTEEAYENIKLCMQQHMIKDSYQDEEFYQISNIYYDTEDNLIIKKSVSKPTFKEKLRLRGYGVINQDSLVFLELKKKINGYVSKRRTQITVREASDFILYGMFPKLQSYHNLQVLREIEYFLNKYQVRPALFLSYEREAYYCNDRPDLRITIDRQIITRRYDLDLAKGIFGKHLLEPGYYVMEIKTNQNFPYWLNEILNKTHSYSSSFSKYGSEFYNYLNETGGNPSCGLNPYLKPLK